jgi:hypothetical protein
VRDYLRALGPGESEFERLHREEIALRKTLVGSGFRASDRMSRDEVYAEVSFAHPSSCRT